MKTLGKMFVTSKTSNLALALASILIIGSGLGVKIVLDEIVMRFEIIRLQLEQLPPTSRFSTNSQTLQPASTIAPPTLWPTNGSPALLP